MIDINDNLTNCICGRTPKLKHEKECWGHGEFPNVYWVQCECGLRGETYSDFETTDPDIMAMAWWNKTMELCNEKKGYNIDEKGNLK